MNTMSESSAGLSNQETDFFASRDFVSASEEGWGGIPPGATSFAPCALRRCAGHAMIVCELPSWASTCVVISAGTNDSEHETQPTQPHDDSATSFSLKMSCAGVAIAVQTETSQVAEPQQPGCACQGFFAFAAFALACATRRD